MQEGTHDRLIELRNQADVDEFADGLVHAIEGGYEVELAYMLGRIDQRAVHYIGSSSTVALLRKLVAGTLTLPEVPKSADDWEDPAAAAAAALHAEQAGPHLEAEPAAAQRG